ncbi:MAG: hypothetical protein JWM59_1749 [Verrucomicrobiales bacterium]|nr:hypothetical protein [Verrucomicrobiales bacterium]
MNFDSEEPMDNQLLQLERELFSLTPVETSHRFACQLEREISVPACPVPVARTLAASHPRMITPFRWQRIVVPAAAAVVVVSVLNRQGNGYSTLALDGAPPQAAAPSAPKIFSSPVSVALRSSRPMNTGYMMVTEQAPLQNVNWNVAPHHYWVNPETPHQTTSPPMVSPRRETVPLSFH